MKPVSILVCLSPSVNCQNITPLAFYNIVNPISSVLNIRMASIEGQIKAFVLLINLKAAEDVISSINEKTCSLGRIKAFFSTKKIINYDKSLSQVLEESKKQLVKKSKDNNGNLFNKVNKANLNSKEYFYTSDNIANKQINKNYAFNSDKDSQQYLEQIMQQQLNLNSKNHNQYKSDRIHPETTAKRDSNLSIPNQCTVPDNIHNSSIYITHNDQLALKSTLIYKFFDQFGRIVKRKLKSPVWEIRYEDKISMEKAISWLKSSENSGYKLVSSIDALSHAQNDINKKPKVESDLEAKKLKYKNMILNLQKTMQSCELKIIDLGQLLKTSKLCKIIAQKYIPVQLIRAYDVKKMQVFFIAQFRNFEEAIAVYDLLMLGSSEIPNLYCEYVNFTIS